MNLIINMFHENSGGKTITVFGLLSTLSFQLDTYQSTTAVFDKTLHLVNIFFCLGKPLSQLCGGEWIIWSVKVSVSILPLITVSIFT